MPNETINTAFRPRSDESDEDSLLSVNYAGFAPVLVEGLKELEQQQQEGVKSMKELAQHQRLEIEEQKLEIVELKNLVRQMVQSQNQRQQLCEDALEHIGSRVFEMESQYHQR